MNLPLLFNLIKIYSVNYYEGNNNTMSLISSIWDEIKSDLRDRFRDAYGSVLDSVRRYLANEIKNWPQYFVAGTSVHEAVVKYCDILVKHLTPDTTI